MIWKNRYLLPFFVLGFFSIAYGPAALLDADFGPVEEQVLGAYKTSKSRPVRSKKGYQINVIS